MLVVEGGNALINCIVEPQMVPQWRISGELYTFMSLPKRFKVRQETFQLEIHSVSTDLNGTTFQCLVIGDYYKIYESPVGTLTVIQKKNATYCGETLNCIAI